MSELVKLSGGSGTESGKWCVDKQDCFRIYFYALGASWLTFKPSGGVKLSLLQTFKSKFVKYRTIQLRIIMWDNSLFFI